MTLKEVGPCTSASLNESRWKEIQPFLVLQRFSGFIFNASQDRFHDLPISMDWIKSCAKVTKLFKVSKDK